MRVAWAYHYLGDLENAKMHYEKSISLAPDDFIGYLNLGVLYKQNGQSEKVQQTWTKGVEIIKRMLDAYPQNPRLRTWLAIFYGYLRNREELLREEARVLREEPDNGYLLMILGRAYAALGETDRAIEFFQGALLSGKHHFYWLKNLKAEGFDWHSSFGGFPCF